MVEEKARGGIANARIVDTFLGIEGHGILIGSMVLNDGQGDRMFGQYVLPGPRAAFFVRRVLETLGLSSWEALLGTLVRAEYEADRVIAVGHILERSWFVPGEEFAGVGDAGDTD